MGLRGQGDRGYAMAALLVSLAVMAVLMSVALPAWRFQARREKEAELVFRGEQYARAVGLFARKNGGAFPPNIDVLLQGRYLRKKYKDPMTADGEFQPLFVGANQPGQPQPGRGAAPGVGTGGGMGQSGRSGRGPSAGLSTGSQSSGPGGLSTGSQSGGPGASVFTSGGLQGGGTGQMTGPGGLMGVVSKSKETSIMIYRGGQRYNEWVFRYAGLQNQPGAAPGQGAPGAPRIGPGGQPLPTAPGTMPRGGRGRGRGTGGFGPGASGSPNRGPGSGVRPPG